MNDGHATGPNGRPGDASQGSVPASDLGEIWSALDSLPRASASIDMAATTIDMAAVTTARSAPRATLRMGRGQPTSWRNWLLPAVAVAGSLIAGIVVGRVTVPDPDLRILESLPLVRHLPLLQEAGSVKFLQSLSARRNQQPLRMPPEMLRDEGREFDAAVADLEADHAWGTVARPLIDERRATIATMAGDERDSIERSAAAFQELTATERRNLATVASALADPKRDELRAAARFWHLIIAASDPPDRKNIVQLDLESRLEWLERRSRVREWMGERRGLAPVIEGGPMPQRVPGPGGIPGDGRPRWQGPRGEGGPQTPRGDGRGRAEPGPRGEGMRTEGGPRGERVGPRPGEQSPELPAELPRGPVTPDLPPRETQAAPD